MRIRYDKAVRDRIPEIIRSTGSTCEVKQIDDNEFLPILERKLLEEVEEYRESGSVGELVDLIEIIYRVLELKGISRDAFEVMRNDKAELRGRFDSNIVLMEVNEI
jgi:predicted house-cleaning noncanonical NTP pyrophosphatase (MazG superfamily)